MINIISVFSIGNILMNLLGVIIGIIFGSIPGLTATMGVALFLPFTFGMDPVTAFALLLGIYVGGIYGGSITAILIRTPGTPSSAATVLDGYPLAQQGKAPEALSAATIASFVGGMFSCLILVMLSPVLAKFALKFGPPEYFAIGLFGLSIVSSLSAKNMLKGILAALFGLMISTVGMDPVTGSVRFTFGNINMMGGIDFVSALIGLFAISEVLFKLEKIARPESNEKIEHVSGGMIPFRVLKKNVVNLIRSSIIGTVIGIIPATGSGMASWLSYNEAKRVSREPELFGKGSYEGVIAAEASNNAVTGGALVPLLTLGVPGDVVTAILMGSLMMQGLTPGPTLFEESGEVVQGIYFMLMLANVFMLILGLLGVNLFVKVLKVPVNVLMPCVLTLTFVGSYAINNSVFDMKAAIVMGILGYLFVKADIPLPPILLGIILGPIIESNFRRAITMSQGSATIFLRPISLVFIILAVIAFCWPIIRNFQDRRKNKAAG